MRFFLVIASLVFPAGLLSGQVNAEDQTGLVTVFEAGEALEFSEADQLRISNILSETHKRVHAFLPDLPDDVTITVTPVDWPLEAVGGVTGRADAPGDIKLQISNTYPGGLSSALEEGLEPAFMHELHHLVRGWTINDNQFGPGIQTAAINEGMAVVFSEALSGKQYPGNASPAEAAEWASEIHTLPLNADYYEWMFSHPDGREAIGYRTGSYIIREAMDVSGLTIVEISQMSPQEVWDLIGYAPEEG